MQPLCGARNAMAIFSARIARSRFMRLLTRFFDKAPGSDDAGDSDTEPDLDSILDEALAARVPLHRLTGHYHSKHESLIAFSNHA